MRFFKVFSRNRNNDNPGLRFWEVFPKFKEEFLKLGRENPKLQSDRFYMSLKNRIKALDMLDPEDLKYKTLYLEIVSQYGNIFAMLEDGDVEGFKEALKQEFI